MSRITKYLKQMCIYEKSKYTEDGKPLLDKFGEPLYEAPIDIRCRREVSIKDVQTNTGAILKSSTCYYIDDRRPIRVGDKLDGETVLAIKPYINQFGLVEGFEVYV